MPCEPCQRRRKAIERAMRQMVTTLSARPARPSDNFRCVASVNDLSVLCIPKNANTSIKRALLAGHDIPKGGLQKHPELNLTEAWNAPAGTIGFVRDPFERVMSAWSDKLQRSAPTPGSQYLIDLGCWMGMPFEDFCAMLPELHRKDVHLFPQTWLVRPDFKLYPLAAIASVWAQLRADHPWLGQLEHRRRSKVRAEYSAQARDMVAQVYAADFDLVASL